MWHSIGILSLSLSLPQASHMFFFDENYSLAATMGTHFATFIFSGGLGYL